MYNTLLHPYLNHAVLNWSRASKTAIQLLDNLQNKAVKFLQASRNATLDEMNIRTHIPTINKIFKISAGKFMHSYENNLLPSHSNQYFKTIQTVHNHPIRLATSKIPFYPG